MHAIGMVFPCTIATAVAGLYKRNPAMARRYREFNLEGTAGLWLALGLSC
jgi:hypothetical protein